jgi:hypothetical protein
MYLEAKLCLEKTIHGFAVVAAIRVIDTLI